MRSEIVKLADKVDANSQVFHTGIAKLTGNFHTEIAKLTDKIEVNTHTIHESREN